MKNKLEFYSTFVNLMQKILEMKVLCNHKSLGGCQVKAKEECELVEEK